MSKVAERVQKISGRGWRPITTAPETSDPFLVYCAPGSATVGSIGLGQRKFLTDGKVDEWRWSEVAYQPLQFVPAMMFDGPEFPQERSANVTPTHWMPLPEPPSEGRLS